MPANRGAEEDDLSKLDVPDLPPSSAFLDDQTILNGASSIRLVERPLPANFLVADAISPLRLSKSEDQGRCQSKYWDHESLNDISQNIRDSADWDDLSKDPIFSFISDSSLVIPLQDLISMYNPHEVREETQEIETQDNRVLQEPSSPKSDNHTTDIMESLEHALSAGRHKQPESNSSTLKDESRLPRETEEIPGVLSAQEQAQGLTQEHREEASPNASRSRSRSSSRPDV